MRRLPILCVIAAGMLALAPFSAALAAQAPQYISSEPADGAELHEAPEAVKVAFTEPLDPSSELRVFACGTRVDDGKTTVSLNQLEVALASGPTGIYEARWVAKGLGGLTGSSEGFIEFSVGHGEPSCDGSGHGSEHGPKKGHGGGQGHQGRGHEGSGTGHSGGSGHSGSTHNSGSSHSSSGSGHSGTSHSSSMGSSDHGSAHGSGKDDAKGGHGSGHSADPAADADGPSNPDLAAGSGPLPIPTPEAGAILLALAACIGLGVTGGWLARLV